MSAAQDVINILYGIGLIGGSVVTFFLQKQLDVLRRRILRLENQQPVPNQGVKAFRESRSTDRGEL